MATDTKGELGEITDLPGRVVRYGIARKRNDAMGDYLTAGPGRPKRDRRELAVRLQNCATYLLFRDYYTAGKVRLTAARFCKKHLLCPLCAIRRGAKMVGAYLDRLAVILAQNPKLRAYLVTLTVKDRPDLLDGFNHLSRSVQALHKTRSGQRQYSEACKAAGAVWSYEFKRGANSGLWHPHVHAVWLCEEAPDPEALARQWHRITADSFIVDVRPFHDQDDVLGGFLEVFKYAVKFSDLELADNVHAFDVLAGKRLIASFGVFRGVQIQEDLTDEPLDGLPYIEHFYRYLPGVGYTLIPRPAAPTEPPRARQEHGGEGGAAGCLASGVSGASSPQRFAEQLPFSRWCKPEGPRPDRAAGQSTKPPPADQVNPPRSSLPFRFWL